MHKVRGPNSKLVTNGPEAQNENKHSSPKKIGCLQQTIVKNQFSGWSLIHNYTEASNGRIWMLWNGDINVSIVAVTDQCITCKV